MKIMGTVIQNILVNIEQEKKEVLLPYMIIAVISTMDCD